MRAAIILLTVVLIAVLAILLAPGAGRGPNDPRFVPDRPASIPPFMSDDYDWLAEHPFEGGKVWMWTYAPSNSHTYLFDLEHREILGALTNVVSPVLCSRDGCRMLCQGQDSSMTSLKSKTLGFVNKLFGGKLPKPDRTETFWFLDVRDNSGTMAGALSQAPGNGSEWHTSPSSRYGYTVPSATLDKWLFLCDLDAKEFQKVPIAGERIKGWWDDQHILAQSGVNEFNLLDIATKKRSTLFGPANVKSFLAQAGLTNTPSGLSAFANWNGREYDFYFGPADSLNGLKNPDAYLLKADRTGPSLKVLYRNFRFRWGGHLDNSGTHYLYQGENGVPGRGGNGAVYLMDLINGTTVTLVPPDNKGQYSIPRFYGNEVIYFQNRLLRRIHLDGSSDAPLLPVGVK